MSHDKLRLLNGIADRFAIYGDLETLSPFGAGHINDTYVSRWNQAGCRIRYVHQRINEGIFSRPDQVMDNIMRVTTHIAAKLAQEGSADRSRRVLTVVPARSGEPWVRDVEGGWWRTYLFVEGAPSHDVAHSPAQVRMLGVAVGRFQKQLTDLEGPRLHETIPGFHNMELRYRAFDAVLAADLAHRARDVRKEVEFLLANRERGAVLVRALAEGLIPERICHNDTKMNNILIDEGGAEALCMADLDTVMPGTTLYDVGDLVRTAANRAEEDGRDRSKVVFDLDYFRALLDGYLSEAAVFLTDAETVLLAEAGRTITQIMALRFLTDHLDGDRYYRINRPGHNLERCRTQIAFIKSMDSHRGAVEEAVAKSVARYARKQ